MRVVSSLEQIWLFLIDQPPQISAPHVPLYHYSHWLRICLTLNFGLYAFDAVSTSSSLAPEAEIRTKTLRLLPVINNNRNAKPKYNFADS
jgi:hypothetical protein